MKTEMLDICRRKFLVFRLLERVQSLIFVLAVGLLWASVSHAETRAAFIVGNSEYENAARLANPVRDARLVGDTLASLGFDVTRHQDLTRTDFSQALADFLAANRSADVTVFYFAGHGMQYEGRNYLVGTDAKLRSELDIEGETIALDKVVELLEKNSKAALVFVDACRDNPLATDFYRRNFSETRALNTRGLARVRSRIDGSMLVFAAAPGQVAYDGDGQNSPFATALATHLPTEGKEILTLTKRIIGDVRDATDGAQSPIVTNDLTKEIFLKEAALRPESDTQRFVNDQGQKAIEAASAWKDFRQSTSPEALERFAEEHSGTAYAALAIEMARRLNEPSKSSPEFLPPEVLPEWCASPGNSARSVICRSAELLSLNSRVDELLGLQLKNAKGAIRGRALVGQRNWALARDNCDESISCIRSAYETRILSLAEFGGNELPRAIVVRSVQEELNRLSCGAGTPDGVDGQQTKNALRLLRRLRPELEEINDVASMETLAQLRSLPSWVCSALYRKEEASRLLSGTWRVDATCDPDSGFPNTKRVYYLTFGHDGGSTFSGRIREAGGRTGTLGFTFSAGSLGVPVVWQNGTRFSVSLLPGDAPRHFVGRDHTQCVVVARPN